MKISEIIVIGAAALILCATAGAVTELNIPVTDFAVIAPPGHSEEGLVLLSFSLPDSFPHGNILRAQLVCNARPVDEVDSVFEITAAPIGIAWNQQDVHWSDSWGEGGGNLVDSMFTYAGVVVGENRTRVEITDMVRAWAAGSRPNYGIVIKAPNDWRVRFRLELPDPNRQEIAYIKILMGD